MPTTNSTRVLLEQCPNTGTILAYRESIVREQIPPTKFIVSQPVVINNLLPPYMGCTSPFSMASSGKEWVMWAKINIWPMSLNMMPMQDKSGVVYLCSPFGRSGFTEIDVEGKKPKAKMTQIQYEVKNVNLFIVLIQGSPWVISKSEPDKWGTIKAPNIYEGGNVCMDPYSKNLLMGSTSQSDDTKKMLNGVTRDSPKAILAAKVLQLFFETPGNSDLAPQTSVFNVKPTDGGKIPDKSPLDLGGLHRNIGAPVDGLLGKVWKEIW